jgi:hypothetical protein
MNALPRVVAFENTVKAIFGAGIDGSLDLAPVNGGHLNATIVIQYRCKLDSRVHHFLEFSYEEVAGRVGLCASLSLDLGAALPPPLG